MSDTFSAVWYIDEQDFPKNGTPAERLRFCLQYAILAPSGHNAQPWQFHIDGNRLSVRADRSHSLPTIDLDGRELVICCASALHLARISLEHYGERPRVDLLPDPTDPDLLATIRLGERGPIAQNRDLFEAILLRSSNRHPFRPRPLAEAQFQQLQDAAAEHGVRIAFATDRHIQAEVAGLIALGDRIKWQDRDFRYELAERIIPNRGRRRDGMPGYAFGVPGPFARVVPTVVRHLDIGRLRAAEDRKLALAAPALAVIFTDRDDLPSWMAAGQALSHILLRATADGLATSFLSQAIEVPELRPRLAHLLGLNGFPQLLLRVGYAQRMPRCSPRRALNDVLSVEVDGSPVRPRESKTPN